MTEPKEALAKKNTHCRACGGSGQTGTFRGESRFQIPWEDCPDCFVTGIDLNVGKELHDPDSHHTP